MGNKQLGLCYSKREYDSFMSVRMTEWILICVSEKITHTILRSFTGHKKNMPLNLVNRIINKLTIARENRRKSNCFGNIFLFFFLSELKSVPLRKILRLSECFIKS